MDGGDLQDDDRATLDRAFDWLVQRHPAAPISAVGEQGLLAPLPASVPVEGRVVLKGRSLLDFVDRAEQVAVVDAWERARRTGSSRALVRLITGESAFLHVVDQRHRHGTYLCLVAPADAVEDGASVLADHTDRSHLPPRLCRLRRDELAIVVDVDDDAVAALGWPREQLVGQRSIELVHPDDVERAIANWMAMLEAPGQAVRWRGRYACGDGSWKWFDITNTNRLEDPAHGDVLAEMVDISDEMAAHEALRERERLLDRLTEALPSGVVQFDTKRQVLHANEQLRRYIGDVTFDAFLAAVVDDEKAAVVEAIDDVLVRGLDRDLEVRLSGERVCRLALRVLTDEAGAVSGGLACVDDVTEASRLRRQLELRATFDGLTACFSRSAILAAMDELGDRPPGTGVIFVDLDRFKDVNDHLGHAAGDELLAAVAARLRQAVREVDVVGRLGGDEFLVLCPGAESAEAVAAIGRRLAQAVAQPLLLRGEHPVVPQASIGTAWRPVGGDLSSLVADADSAMYAAKRGR